jgi:chaperonin GroES
MKAYGNRILIDPTPIEKVTPSGIILQPKEEDKPSKGLVVSIGKQVTGISVNDVVHFNKYTPIEVKEGDKKYLVIKDEDVYTIE